MSRPKTEALAGFVAEFDPGHAPAEVMERVVDLVIDGSGCLLAAANPEYSTGRLIAAFVREQGGLPEAGVVGYGFRTGVVHAALANGTMGYACDFEPHHPEAILHPIAVMLPTALAIGERVGATGSDLLAAIALGCEIEYRVSMSLGPAAQYALGFHPSAVSGCFGATAAASFLLKLNEDAVTRAFGLAAGQASGLMAWESDPSENARPFQTGIAARNGVTAALLATGGFGGPRGVFDQGHTVFEAFSRAPQPELLTEGLGVRWDGVTELAIKPYPCVAFLHPALDALAGIVSDEGLRTDEVDRLVLRFARSGLHCIDDNPLKSHSAQYVLAVALARGRLEVADLFTDRRVSDTQIRALADRIWVEPDDGELEALFPNAYATEIEIRTNRGRVHLRRQDVARGYPETPLQSDEIEAKFEGLVTSVSGPERVTALLGAIRALPGATSLERYAGLMVAPVEGIRL